MKQFSGLRTLGAKNNTNEIHMNGADRNTPHTTGASAKTNSDSELPYSLKSRPLSTYNSPVYEHEVTGGVRGCVEAISACLAAIATAHAADKQALRQAAADATPEPAFPPLPQTSKRAGTTQCWDSARELLRFFGHSPMLHAEGVVWIKASGKRGDLSHINQSSHA